MFKYNFEQSKKELNKALLSKNGHELFYKLSCFLYHSFALREKYITKEKIGYIIGLKRFYNICKHNYNKDEIKTSLIPKNNKEVLHPKFMPIDNIQIPLMPKPKEVAIKSEINKYNKYVKGKRIDFLCDSLYKSTERLTKKYQCLTNTQIDQ